MFLGVVTGSIWGARQAAGLEGLKLLQVRPVALPGSEAAHVRHVSPGDCALQDRVIVAADTLGAGPGEHVLVAMGSRVRDVVYDTRKPVKAVIIAIVDSARIGVGAVS